MSSSASIEFVVQRSPYFSGVVPVVGGVSLLDLIHEFEARSGFDVPGGYVPLTHRPGAVSDFYLGEADDGCCEEGKTALLGCTCGESGCWPLCCRIQASRSSVRWSDFEQPFRPERDYDGFGPFVFDREEYEAALVALARAAGSR